MDRTADLLARAGQKVMGSIVPVPSNSLDATSYDR
jgi:hypothetical protein